MIAPRSEPSPERLARPDSTGPVGYILQKFPVLSETFILNEILALEKRGVEVHIFSLDRPDEACRHDDFARLNATITYLPRWSRPKHVVDRLDPEARDPWPRLRALAAIVRTRRRGAVLRRLLDSIYVAHQARRRGVRHLHSHYANDPTTVAYFTSRITGIPYSFTAHAWDIYQRRYTRPPRIRALRRRIAHARYAITVSNFNKAYLQSVAPSSASKIVRIYNGIDLERFAPSSPPETQPFTLLAVCRLVEKKGMGIFIEACRHLLDSNVGFQSWIVGAGNLHAQLEAQVDASRLSSHVRLLGPLTQHQVLARYRAAHLFVLPCVVGSDGNRDGLPVSVVEALACGLPVVTTPMTGIPEIVRHRHNGLLVPAADPVAVADAIKAVISDGSLYDRLRANARASVEAAFDLQGTAAELAQLFATSIAEGRRAQRNEGP